MKLTPTERRIVTARLKPDAQLGTTAALGLSIWIFVSFFISGPIGSYLTLVYFYGFGRVYRDGLHFIANTHLPTQKGADLIVSNGDHISQANAFIGVPLTLAVWLALSLMGYVVIKLCSRWRKQAHWQTFIKEVS